MAVSFSKSNQDSYSRDDSSSYSYGEATGSSESESGQFWSPEQLARIGQLYPYLMSQYQSAGQQRPWNELLAQIGGPNQVFAPLPEFPTITEGPIWTPQQIQERVNQTMAQSDMGTAGMEQKLINSMTGATGYGYNSPLLKELTTSMYGRNLADKLSGENNLRWGAAEGNARHLLDSQKAGVARSTALSDAQLSREQAMSEDELRRRQLAVVGQGQQLQYDASRQNALLQALSYYNQPLSQSKSKSTQKSYNTSGSMSSSRSGSSSSSRSGSYSEPNDSWDLLSLF